MIKKKTLELYLSVKIFSYTLEERNRANVRSSEVRREEQTYDKKWCVGDFSWDVWETDEVVEGARSINRQRYRRWPWWPGLARRSWALVPVSASSSWAGGDPGPNPTHVRRFRVPQICRCRPRSREPTENLRHPQLSTRREECRMDGSTLRR